MFTFAPEALLSPLTSTTKFGLLLDFMKKYKAGLKKYFNIDKLKLE